jgi:translation initiation factor 1A
MGRETTRRDGMPNQTGGKNYKKKKKDGGETERIVFIDREEGQEPARVIKLFGNCNVQLYCNDGRTRVGHIRGSMQKKVWINVGDIVLVSLRDDTGAKVGEERADILAKYDPRALSKLKKEDGVNPKLFLMIENMDAAAVGSGAAAPTRALPLPEEDDDFFDRSEEPGEGEAADGEKTEGGPVRRGVENTWGGQRGGKREAAAGDEVDIDAI